ncbi:MAG: dephospho-CoA kinase [Christensenellales bacterium]
MLIAITGGIGSGKSTVLQMVASLGGNIINADEINKELMGQDFYIEKIRALFPDAVREGTIDKAKLADTVFFDREAMRKLNELAHPLINERILQRAKEAQGMVFVEVPLLIESNMQKQFDKVWLVKADMQLRLERIQSRSKISESMAKRIMSLQEQDTTREKYATDIIINDGDNENLFNQVKELYSNLLNG